MGRRQAYTTKSAVHSFATAPTVTAGLQQARSPPGANTSAVRAGTDDRAVTDGAGVDVQPLAEVDDQKERPGLEREQTRIVLPQLHVIGRSQVVGAPP